MVRISREELAVGIAALSRAHTAPSRDDVLEAVRNYGNDLAQLAAWEAAGVVRQRDTSGCDPDAKLRIVSELLKDQHTAPSRDDVLEEAAKMVGGGRFLHDQAPTALFAKECSAAIRRLKNQPTAAPVSEKKNG